MIGSGVLRRLPAQAPPWTTTYPIARTLLASSLALTLALNSPDTLFVSRPLEGIPSGVQCQIGISELGLFCLAGGTALHFKQWLAVAVLVLAASGYRPRWLGVPHWWLTFSFQANAGVVDGGDQLAAILCLLLIPVTLLDGRRWHWSAKEMYADSAAARFVAWWCYGLVRLQVAAVYFHAAMGKVQVTEWVDGTALYYWVLHPGFGAPAWLLPLVRPIVLSGPAVAVLTWGVVLLEFLLAAALLARDDYRFPLLVAGLLLHAGILIIHGLVSFSLVMFAALLLYLPPDNRRRGWATVDQIHARTACVPL